MPVLKIHILQHEPFEGAGLIADWAAEKGHTTTITLVYEKQPLPPGPDFDWLVIMGGGMSVNDEDKYDWLKPEKQFVRRVIEAGKVVIGICLGSQMLANVLGKRVYKNPVKEIGWWPVQLTDAGKKSDFLTPGWDGQMFFHWHGETFDLPDGAQHLAISEGCKNQAFSIGKRIFGFQFHPETNLQTLHQMVNSGSREMVRDKFVMEPNEVLANEHAIQTTQPLVYGLLNKIVAANNS
ncbi:MAG TPA: type 1 glutamine amidotransferase [Chitinophagales bacterium]|nr:type 1 glutamine amidotransferase [Chitinophagales bacterium]